MTAPQRAASFVSAEIGSARVVGGILGVVLLGLVVISPGAAAV
jgi:hypothetical protein